MVREFGLFFVVGVIVMVCFVWLGDVRFVFCMVGGYGEGG